VLSENNLSTIRKIEDEYNVLEGKLATPEIANDSNKLKKLSKRFFIVGQVLSKFNEYSSTEDDIEVAKQLGMDDEIESLSEKVRIQEKELLDLLIERDPQDSSDVIMEIMPGSGGEEAALFASELLRMYDLYSQKKGWSFKVLSSAITSNGGIKNASVSISNKASGFLPKDGIWANMKFEGGVHRVQRVPTTETQGRIHTSAAGVYVFPEVEDEEVKIDPNELKIDVYRSSGPGGQSVNTTDSAVRITHIPTGITVSMQDEKSQIKNKAAGMKVLISRIEAHKREEQEKKDADSRHSQITTVDRSQKMRTYNFPEKRIVDHRTGYKAYNLDQVMNGDLDELIKSSIDKDMEIRMAEFS
jgi:peptide chain release factor 1